MDATTTQRARAGLRKIRHQFPATPEGQLMYSVVAQAVADFVAPEPRTKYREDYFRHLHWDINVRAADNYLRSDMPHADKVGVDPEWIRRVFKRLGINF